MPDGAPIMKVETPRAGRGGLLVPGTYDDAHDKAVELQDETGMTFIHPFDDDEQVIAGQGTIGLEILDQLPDVDAVIVPVGGGGLISGVAFAIKSLRPRSRSTACRPRVPPACTAPARAQVSDPEKCGHLCRRHSGQDPRRADL